MESSTVSVIVPAAGQSSRFGAADKLRMPWCGSTILGTVVSLAEQCTPLEVILVVADPRLEGGEGPRLVLNPRPECGMASSIAVGVRAASSRATGFLVWPADMPVVPPRIVKELIELGSAAGSFRPRYRGVPGHPVLFGNVYRKALERLERGSGAKHLLGDVVYLETDEPGVTEDIDTPATYEKLRSAHA